jgi:hypothetical protein
MVLAPGNYADALLQNKRSGTLSKPVSDYETSNAERPLHRGVWIPVRKDHKEGTDEKNSRHDHAHKKYPALF